MNILIDNVGFINKGAELMLNAVRDKMLKLFPESDFILRPGLLNSKKSGFYELRDQKSQWMIPLNIIPTWITKLSFKYVSAQKISLIIDAGGFRFGDQLELYYSEKIIEKWINFYKDLKNRGCKIVLLPQAFGPFNNELSRRYIEGIFPFLDLCIARDEKSYKYLEELFGKKKIKRFPDFTNIYMPVLSEKRKDELSGFENKICIIPNSRMITNTSSEVSNSYIQFMVYISKTLIREGYEIFLLNHEGPDDELLMKKIVVNGLDVRCLTGLDADNVKYLIGKSKIVITSRYHGLVSALSQGVPGYCTSWSHKYEQLLKDYNFTEGLLDIFNHEICINQIFSQLEDSRSFEKSRIKLNEKANEEKYKTELMWDEVKKILIS
jgi:polysaccharide pyruvyl transferase WcaK-like protein